MIITRRTILQLFPIVGISSTVFARSLAQEAVGKVTITKEMIVNAQWVSGIELTESQIELLQTELNSLHNSIEKLNKIELDLHLDIPALTFQPLHWHPNFGEPPIVRFQPTQLEAGKRPASDDDLAFLSLTELSRLIRDQQISSLELTTLYLERLKRYDPMLRCVVNVTEKMALQQAKQADLEISQEKYRGPLHGIPWGAKDSISVSGYPTTWGIPLFKDRIIDQTATVAKRLELAGAVLIAKLSLGALARGDQWYGGMTRNPWNPNAGSGGSSSGSAASTAAGLVGFSLASETLGSILFPSMQCGTCGLRPTFGRVSRDGCMPLSFSMDKVGPIARSVEDLALVFGAIVGPDGQDPTVSAHNFIWPPPELDFSSLRVGILKHRDESASPDASLEIIRSLGCELIEVELPTEIPWQSLAKIIIIEAAAVFNDLLRAGETTGWNTWIQSFQSAQFVTAIDYLKMQSVRRKLMLAFDEMMSDIDILWNAQDLPYSNFTGHPSVAFPTGVRSMGNRQIPKTVVATGHLFDEARLLAFCHAYQKKLLKPVPHPPVDDWLAKFNQGKLESRPKTPEPKFGPDNGH